MMIKPKAPGPEPATIQSLVRAFSILEIIARHPAGIGLSDLSRQIGLHNSTAFHLVRTMSRLGYVAQAPDSKVYRIGGRLFHLAAASLHEVELLTLVTPFVRQLSQETSDTAQFGVRSGDQAAVLAKADGGGAFQTSERVGGSRPSYCTALGKVILADLSDEEFQHYLQSHDLVRHTPNTITDKIQLKQEIMRVREAGVAFDDEEFHSDLRCVAMPVRDFTRRVVGAIGVSGPIWRFSLHSLEKRTAVVRETARRLSAELGYREELVNEATPV